jgi:predicted extracellular nuclease
MHEPSRTLTGLTTIGALALTAIGSLGLLASPASAADPAAACTGPATPIPAIQGTNEAAAITGAVTIRGVVVGDFEGASPALRGFYLQDPTGDNNPATSDGIFVFEGVADNVSVGQLVQVTGTVAEFQGQTQLTATLPLASSVVVCGQGPTVKPAKVRFPLASSTELEQYEGMLVTFPEVLTVTEQFLLGRFGQVTVSAGGRLEQPTSEYRPTDPKAAALQASNNLNRILIDDATNAQNPDPIRLARGTAPVGGNILSAANTLRGGDTVEDAVGVLTYTWGGNASSPNAYRLRPIGSLGGAALFKPANPRPATAPAVGGTLQVASSNLLNYFNTTSGCKFGVGGAAADCRGAETAVELQRQTAKEVAALSSLNADVIGLMEIENDGYAPGSAIADLVGKLNAASAPGTWAFVDADSAVGRVNAAGTDAIKAALLYRPAEVTPVAGTTQVYPIAGAFERNPIAQTFALPNGAKFTVVVNHLKSKGCDGATGANLDAGDGQGCFNARRTAEATTLASWIDSTVVPAAGDPDVLIIGDLNSYAKEDPISTLDAAGFKDMIDSKGDKDPYSYVFDGQWGYLDHALATKSLRKQVTAAADVHINADEPSVLDYNTNFKTAGQVASLYAPDQFRNSDHDPVLIGLTPTP